MFKKGIAKENRASTIKLLNEKLYQMLEIDGPAFGQTKKLENLHVSYCKKNSTKYANEVSTAKTVNFILFLYKTEKDVYEAAQNLDDYNRRLIEVELNILKQTQETAERCGRARRGILYNPLEFPSSQYPSDEAAGSSE